MTSYKCLFPVHNHLVNWNGWMEFRMEQGQEHSVILTICKQNVLIVDLCSRHCCRTKTKKLTSLWDVTKRQHTTFLWNFNYLILLKASCTTYFIGKCTSSLVLLMGYCCQYWLCLVGHNFAIRRRVCGAVPPAGIRTFVYSFRSWISLVVSRNFLLNAIRDVYSGYTCWLKSRLVVK